MRSLCFFVFTTLLVLGTHLASGQNVSSIQWVPFNGSIPSNAVVGGVENGQPMYVGRVPYEGGVHPGKIIGGGFCNIGWGGKEYSVNQGFEVLTAAPNAVKWVEYNGSLPANAIQGGYNSAGGADPLYIAKAAYNGGEHCGKLWANACNIGWGGQEIVLKDKIYILVSAEIKGQAYTLEINYNGYGALNNTGTLNEIYMRVLDSNRSLLWDNASKAFTTPATAFTVNFTVERPVASILIRTSGDDAFWIDRMVLKKDNKEVMHWGVIGGKGWCLSTDANDGKTAPLKDFITPADGCKDCFEFLINGKYNACPFEGGQ